MSASRFLKARGLRAKPNNVIDINSNRLTIPESAGTARNLVSIRIDVKPDRLTIPESAGTARGFMIRYQRPYSAASRFLKARGLREKTQEHAALVRIPPHDS